MILSAKNIVPPQYQMYVTIQCLFVEICVCFAISKLMHLLHNIDLGTYKNSYSYLLLSFVLRYFPEKGLLHILEYIFPQHLYAIRSIIKRCICSQICLRFRTHVIYKYQSRHLLLLLMLGIITANKSTIVLSTTNCVPYI